MDTNAVVVADLTGTIRFWSPGAAEAFGHPAHEAVGQTLNLIVPPEHRDAHWIGFRRALETGVAAVEGVKSPFPVRRADGTVAVAPGRLTLLREPDGRPIAAVVVFG